MKVVAAGLVVLGMFMTSGAPPYAPRTQDGTGLPSTRDVSHGQSSEKISGHRKNFRRTFAITEKRFVMLADLQRPALQENERLGSMTWYNLYPSTLHALCL